MSNIKPYEEQDAWGNLEKEDFALPIVKIAQGTTKKGTPGTFVYNNGLEIKDMLSCVLLRPNKARVLYGPKRGGPSVCGSNNWNQPSIRYDNPVSHNCHHCILSRWDNQLQFDEQEEKRRWEIKLNLKTSVKPVCTEVYQLLMLDKNNSPFMITFTKTQIKVVEETLLSRVRNEFGVPWGARFDMKVIKKDDGENIWYNVEFSNFIAIAKETLPQLVEKRNNLSYAHDSLDQEYARQDEEAKKQIDNVPWDDPTDPGPTAEFMKSDSDWP